MLLLQKHTLRTSTLDTEAESYQHFNSSPLLGKYPISHSPLEF